MEVEGPQGGSQRALLRAFIRGLHRNLPNSAPDYAFICFFHNERLYLYKYEESCIFLDYVSTRKLFTSVFSKHSKSLSALVGILPIWNWLVGRCYQVPTYFLVQWYPQGSPLTHHSPIEASIYICILLPLQVWQQQKKNNTDATFVIVYFWLKRRC